MRHSLVDLGRVRKIDHYFKMRFVLELIVNQGSEERRQLTMAYMTDWMACLFLWFHAHDDDDENRKNIFASH